MLPRLRRLFTLAAGCMLGVAAVHAAEPAGDVTSQAFDQAARSAPIAGYALAKVHRWLDEVALPCVDPETKLLKMRGVWNYHNTAADCYPFLCWAAHVTDRQVLDGPLRDVLRAEIALCNHLDRIPAPYDFDAKAKVAEYPIDRLMFGASEYVKDGLIAIVEVTGRDEWFERMAAIEEDMWKHAQIDTPYGKIPSGSDPVRGVEIDGEQLQALCRLYAMTGQPKFLTWAERLGDYYLKRDGFVPPHLRDHGCEIVGGLGLLVAVESEANPDKLREYLPPMKRMLDEILARGTNPDGFMYNAIEGTPSRFEPGSLSDGWGYNYVAYLCYDMACGAPHYRQQIDQTLRNLAKPVYLKGGVAGTGGDSLADSAEGAMYLLNRRPVSEGLAWVDRWMEAGLIRSDVALDRARLWGANKWESNCVRTVIMHALMHTQGLIARPRRDDLELGASQTAAGLAVVMRAQEPWSGKIVFDLPRHRLYLGFRHDWPRMNTLPEWFTVEPDKTYTVRNRATGAEMTCTGEHLHNGLALELEPGVETRLFVQ